jgi:type VI protein secretion system component VasF
MPAETAERPIAIRLAQMCWPVFEFLTNFTRSVKHGTVAPPEQLWYEARSALRDAEELASDDPITEKQWHDRVKPMMVYLLDYKMLNTDWEGRDYWFEHRFETHPEVLNKIDPLGGEEFFTQCDEVQKEYEQAERRDRRDKDEFAGVLNLYFTCLRLGFKGKYHDYPQELADYTRRLFARLPAQVTTRGKEMFPETYKHNQEVKVDYRLGMSLTIVLLVFATVIGSSLVTFQMVWRDKVSNLKAAANDVQQRHFFEVEKKAAAPQ